MCYIYENALVTLAGLHSPSSDTGLFLSSPYRRTAKLEAHINQIPVTIYARKTYDIGVLGIMHGHLQDSSGSLRGSGILETRGWTLQEVVLSPRILWFSSAELGWSCWSSTACECTPELTSKWLSGSAKRIKVSSSLLLNPKAATEYLATWRTLVPEFTKRILTVPTDRLPALSGLASALQTHLNSRYLAGLWESDLSKELIWASEWELVDANLDKSYLPLDDGYAPSWSWSSISGAVRFIDEVYTAHFRLTWQVVSVRFQHLGEDPFGRGQGSVTMEGDWLQVRWVDGFLVWDSPVCEGTSVETVLFCDRDDILMDPRAGIQDKKAVASKHLSFLVAGMLMKNSKSVNPDDPSLCCGLVLEYLPDKRVFKRLGFGEPHFNRSDMERRWDVWEKRYSRIKIDII
jgi:hypothetical protein